ncbi:MAG TPA: NAD(P)H-dependent glycerol-3-phosphate dehydrogenase [bacterium]|nr:NAD(P)H-dependent glycerol-3-phosphate dehydrogenase [bacterium]
MKLAVLGSGSWGTTLGLHLAQAGHSVSLFSSSEKKARELEQKRENRELLPGIKIPDSILISADLDRVLEGAEGVVFSVPSHVLRTVAKRAAPLWPQGAWALSASKGLEEGTHDRMSQILGQVLPAGTAVGVLSGPSHAEEVAQKIPTTVVVASAEPSLPGRIQAVFHTDYFRVYTSPDIVGVELGGALKNVIAIAAGILDGLGLGDNTKAALMTRGLHEMRRLGVGLGASAETFSGLTGMGDLMVTCVSRHSRNRLLGEKIGKGATLKQALSEMSMVAEGVRTAKSAVELAEQAGVEVPIMRQVYGVLYEGRTARESMAALLSRAARPETDPS